MGKFMDYPTIEAFDEDAYLLTDSPAGGTKKILASNAALSALSLNAAYVRRNIFRGKNLGGSLTSTQKSAIQLGTFENLWLGDYWEIGGVKYRIADFDYWFNCGDNKFTTHHLVIVPDTSLGTAKMNDTSVTTGGYISSQMYTTNMESAKTTITNAFSSAVLTHREFLINAVTSGYPSAGAWTNSSVELMNEPMVYGSYIYTPGNDGTIDVKRYTCSHTQLALFRAAPSFILTEGGYWLRDVVSGLHFARVDSYGGATSSGAANTYGIRPAFPIG